MIMDKKLILLPLFLLLFLTFSTEAKAVNSSKTQRPNIIIMVADDFGLSRNEKRTYPALDSLEKNGVAFTRAYSTAPVCGPSRAGIVTGRYQQKFGFELNPNGMDDPAYGLTPSEKTIADLLVDTDYVTGAFGKWHLGMQEGMHPMDKGFDEFFGFLGGVRGYYPTKITPDTAIYQNRTIVPETDEYTPDRFCDATKDFIRANKERPFFIYYAPSLCHGVWGNHGTKQIPNGRESEFEDVTEKERGFTAKKVVLDEKIGEILATLKEEGLEENTLFLFMGDNGGGAWFSETKFLRGGKQLLYEGGTRVLMLAQWKGILKPNSIIRAPVSLLDLAPTVLDLAGVNIPENLDGVSLVPCLKDNEVVFDRPLFWRYGRQIAVSYKDWKLVRSHNSIVESRDLSVTPPLELYNLKTDVMEKTNVLGQNPEMARELKQMLDVWNATLIFPRWGSKREQLKDSK